MFQLQVSQAGFLLTAGAVDSLWLCVNHTTRTAPREQRDDVTAPVGPSHPVTKIIHATVNKRWAYAAGSLC